MKVGVIIIGGLFVAMSALWGYKWYLARITPSEVDHTQVSAGEAVAYVAGGCFWCVESDFEKLPGVQEAVSGYMGGALENPSYKEVASGSTTHRESVKVMYDPTRLTYRTIVLYLLKHTDPTDEGGSFFDRGRQYTSAVYYQTDEERLVAEDVVRELTERGVYDTPIATSIEPAGAFWVAEEYHQDYYKKNPIRYNYYRSGSGRDDYIESIWGSGEHDDLFADNLAHINKWENWVKPSASELKKRLTPIQYQVTQKDATERPFENEYWDNHEEGIYVDVVSGEPLFSSTDKFDSGTGWPSFLKPIDLSFVTEHDDYKLLTRRTEIRSKYADSHLGHIILDGPVENDRIRYCMNSAALRFVPIEDLEKEGLGEYMYLFKSNE